VTPADRASLEEEEDEAVSVKKKRALAQQGPEGGW
jgi:hypothetical protein